VLEELEGFTTERVDYDLGGRRYLATGEVLSDATLEELRGFDAIYLGAVGTPDVPPGVIERRACCSSCGSPSTSTSTCARSSSTRA
jgi:isocitrate/isopropylmalate dehydrogenase